MSESTFVPFRSLSEETGVPYHTLYNASKRGVIDFVKQADGSVGTRIDDRLARYLEYLQERPDTTISRNPTSLSGDRLREELDTLRIHIEALQILSNDMVEQSNPDLFDIQAETLYNLTADITERLDVICELT